MRAVDVHMQRGCEYVPIMGTKRILDGWMGIGYRKLGGQVEEVLIIKLTSF